MSAGWPADPSGQPPLPNVGDPFVPLPGVDEALADSAALESWHRALSDALAPDLPHDLLAFWLFPARGGAVLLGPTALAQDRLTVPVPPPTLDRERLRELEEVIRDAGYRSAAATASRSGRRDVGLLLLADFRPGRYGAAERMLLDRATAKMAPTLARMAWRWGAAGEGSRGDANRLAGLVDLVAVADAEAGTLDEAGTLEGYVVALSGGLEPLLPHDRLELLHPDEAVTALFGGAEDLIVADASGDPRWARARAPGADPEAGALRALVGARVGPGDRPLGFLLAGSSGPHLYDERDARLMSRLAALVAPRVELFLQGVQRRPGTTSLPEPPDGLTSLAELLATTAGGAEATRAIADAVARLVAYDRLSFALLIGGSDRVVLFEPGESRPLAELLPVPVAGTALARVLHGEVPHVLGDTRDGCRLVVSLRVAGRVHGALALSSRRFRAFHEADVPPLRRLADLVAPHLALLRRSSFK